MLRWIRKRVLKRKAGKDSRSSQMIPTAPNPLYHIYEEIPDILPYKSRSLQNSSCLQQPAPELISSGFADVKDVDINVQCNANTSNRLTETGLSRIVNVPNQLRPSRNFYENPELEEINGTEMSLRVQPTEHANDYIPMGVGAGARRFSYGQNEAIPRILQPLCNMCNLTNCVKVNHCYDCVTETGKIEQAERRKVDTYTFNTPVMCADISCHKITNPSKRTKDNNVSQHRQLKAERHQQMYSCGNKLLSDLIKCNYDRQMLVA